MRNGKRLIRIYELAIVTVNWLTFSNIFLVFCDDLVQSKSIYFHLNLNDMANLLQRGPR